MALSGGCDTLTPGEHLADRIDCGAKPKDLKEAIHWISILSDHIGNFGFTFQEVEDMSDKITNLERDIANLEDFKEDTLETLEKIFKLSNSILRHTQRKIISEKAMEICKLSAKDEDGRNVF